MPFNYKRVTIRKPDPDTGSFSFYVVACFSIIYFVETIIRASEKRFWFDELATYYICRLPTFHDSWVAVLHGADYNPPLFYLVERANMALFGAGLIAMRLPQILGFWVLCLCLFFFVSRRVGVLAGSTAMAAPLITGAYFYAYEARPHGLVLGFCGLALLCWDRVERQRTSTFWLLAFSLCLEAAFLMHCYAILIAAPFALVEAVRGIQSRQLNWRVWLALITPAVIAAISFLPLLRSYRANLQSTGFNITFPATSAQFLLFFQELFRPFLPVLIVMLVLFASKNRFGRLCRRWAGTFGTFHWDLLLLAGFLLVPLYGLLLAKILHSPFFARYFMSAVIGVSGVVGVGVGLRARDKLAVLVPVMVGVLVVRDASGVVLNRLRGYGEYLSEPSSKVLINTAIGDNLAIHPLLRDNRSKLPVAVPSILDFLYLVHYWPKERARLFEVVPSRHSGEYTIIHPLREWGRVSYNEEPTYDDFFRAHRDFLLYGHWYHYFLLTRLVAAGAQIRSLKFEGTEHFLAEIHMPDHNTAAR